MIYGGPFGVMPAIPAKLPPLFLAWMQDDLLVRGRDVKFHAALEHAGQKPEVHIYCAGGHGFGLKKRGTTSDHWIEAFYKWLDAQGLAKARPR
jgi:acetyl esterase/lipase